MLPGFGVERESQTLRDAVTFSQLLGTRDLWIDCLCIIQDCQEDELIEIAKMHDIFHNAFCAISATSASAS